MRIDPILAFGAVKVHEVEANILFKNIRICLGKIDKNENKKIRIFFLRSVILHGVSTLDCLVYGALMCFSGLQLHNESASF